MKFVAMSAHELEEDRIDMMYVRACVVVMAESESRFPAARYLVCGIYTLLLHNNGGFRDKYSYIRMLDLFVYRSFRLFLRGHDTHRSDTIWILMRHLLLADVSPKSSVIPASVVSF